MKENRMIRKLLAVSMAALMIGGAGLYVPGAMTGTGITADAASDVSINSQDVTIYCMSPDYKDKLTMPGDLPREFQLKVTGASNVSYRVTSGSSVKVTSDGLIKPKRTLWKWSGNFGVGVDESQYPDDNDLPENITVEYSSGESEITVIADAKTYKVKVTVVDYSDKYANDVMDNYLNDNITSNMTDEQKLTKIAQFIASYDYSPYYQSYKGMIINGGGDCWASTNTAIAMAKKLGYTAVVRNGNQDSGGGSGHRNALIFTNSGYYIIEAGYAGNAPRSYDVTKKSSLFSYRYDSNGGIQVYQYDGLFDSDTFEFPSSIDGKTVTSIGNKFSSYSYNITDEKIKKVIIPDTVKSIGSNAFWGFDNLEEINIPASLETLAAPVFPTLTKIKTITSRSPRFKAIGTLVYDDEKKTVVAAPSIENAVIPEDTKIIGTYAFYRNSNLKTVNIPSSLEKLEEGAFCQTSSLGDLDLKNTKITEIGRACFAECKNMTKITLPETLTSIGELAFYSCSGLKSVIIPASVTSIGDEAFGNCTALEVIYGKPGTAAEEYAKANNIEFKEVKEVNGITLSKSAITLAKGNTYMLNAVFSPSDAADKSIEWKTGNSDIATVENGKIKAVGTGKVTIRAKTANGKTASCRVTVVNKLVNNSTVIANTVQVGDDIRLTAAAKGGTGEYQYAFYFKRSTNTNWTTLADFSTKKNAVLIPKAAADYDLKVVVKDKCGLKAEKTFTVKAVSSLALKNMSTVGSTSIKKGGSVRLYGKSIGGAKPVKYQFYFKRESNSTWKRLNASDENATSAKLTPSSAVVYDLKVTAIDANGVKSEKTFKLTVK